MGIIGQFFGTRTCLYRFISFKFTTFWFEGIRGKLGLISHPLGTENSGGYARSFNCWCTKHTHIGVVAAVIGMSVGILLGFTSGYLGGRVDDVIRLISDVTITSALMILVVINALLRQIDIITMALLIALFIWPSRLD